MADEIELVGLASQRAAGHERSDGLPPQSKPPHVGTARNGSQDDEEGCGEGGEGGQQPSPLRPSSALLMSTMNLTNSVIGAGILGIPFAISQIGFVLGLTALAAFAGLAAFGAYLLLVCADANGVWSYEAIAQCTLGVTGRLVYNLTCLVISFGACCSYLIVLGDVLAPILAAWAEGLDNPFVDVLVSRMFVTVALTLVVVFPLSSLRDISSLSATSTLSVAIYACFVAIVVGHASVVLHGRGGTTATFTSSLAHPGHALSSLPIMCFAFAFHTSLLPLYSELRDPTVRRMMKATLGSIGISLVIYALVGVCGVLLYTTATRGDILINFHSDHSPMLEALQVAFAISVVFTFPVVHYPARQSLHSLTVDSALLWPLVSPVLRLFRRPSATVRPTRPLVVVRAIHTSRVKQHTAPIPTRRRLVETAVLVLGALLVATVTQEIEVVLGLAGAVGGAMVSYVLPGMFYVLTVAKQDRRAAANGAAKATDRAAANATVLGSVLLVCLGVLFAVISVLHMLVAE